MNWNHLRRLILIVLIGGIVCLSSNGFAQKGDSPSSPANDCKPPKKCYSSGGPQNGDCGPKPPPPPAPPDGGDGDGSGDGGGGDSGGGGNPGGDHPDDTADVSSPGDLVLKTYSYAETALLMNGFYRSMGSLLEKMQKTYALHSQPSVSADMLKDHPILLIPSGALYGWEGSYLFKRNLEDYVKQGGILLC